MPSESARLSQLPASGSGCGFFAAGGFSRERGGGGGAGVGRLGDGALSAGFAPSESARESQGSNGVLSGMVS